MNANYNATIYLCTILNLKTYIANMKSRSMPFPFCSIYYASQNVHSTKHTMASNIELYISC